MVSGAAAPDATERLTALVNVLGFASLDHLEDYVILLGPAKIVPADSSAAAGSSLAVDDTQTQWGASYADATRAHRNLERKRENLRLRSEVDGLRKEKDWLRTELEKQIDVTERLRKEKAQLREDVEEAVADAPEKNARAREAAIDTGQESELVALASQNITLCEELEECVARTVELEEQIAEAQTDYDDLAQVLEQVENKLEETNIAYDDALIDMGAMQDENDRLRLVEAEFLNFKRSIGALQAQSSSTPVPMSLSRPRFVHALRRSRLSTSTPTGSPSAGSPAPISTPSAASALSTPQLSGLGPIEPYINGPSRTPADGRSRQSNCASTSAADAGAQHRSSTPVAASDPEATTAGLIHQPDGFAPDATKTALLRNDGIESHAIASGSTPRITSVQSRQLKQYPLLLSAYQDSIGRLDAPQNWANNIIPSVRDTLLSSLPSPPPVPIYPSHDFPFFEPLPATLSTPTGAPGCPWIEDGSLHRRYAELEEAEKRIVKRVKDWDSWIRSAKSAVRKDSNARDEGGKGKSRQGETPTSVKTLVKKRRRISKDGASATPTTSALHNSLNVAPTPSDTCRVRSAAAGPTSSSSAATQRAAQGRIIVPQPGSRSAREGDTQIPPSPGRPAQREDLDRGTASTAKKKNWNLLSPKKKRTGSSISKPISTACDPLQTPGSPSRRPPIASEPRSALLVDDTQLPVDALRSEAPLSEFEPEPDTLKSTGDDPDDLQRPRARTKSLSPRKGSSPLKKSPLRRTSAVSHESSTAWEPRPPFSPSYAAKMQRAATNAAAAISVENVAASASSRSPFQPSPNRLSQQSQSRSPSSSPLKMGTSMMPPSAQLPRPIQGTADDDDTADQNTSVENYGLEPCPSRRLLFSATGNPASPTKKPAKANEKRKEGIVIKREVEEELDNDPFAEEVMATLRTAGTTSPSPQRKKGKKRKSETVADEERSAKKSRNSGINSFAGDRGDDDGQVDEKPRIEHDVDPDDIGDMPMGPEDEAARRLWFEKLKQKRHEKVLLQQQEKASKASSGARVELNPDRNQGERHAFKQTERRKAVRKSMLAEACGNCQAYYERKQQPVPLGHCTHVGIPADDATPNPKSKGNFLDVRAAEVEKRMQQDGRHRAAQRTVPDPPDYWQMGFPSTQQAEQINAKARQQKAELERHKVLEAEQANGLYRFRNEQS